MSQFFHIFYGFLYIVQRVGIDAKSVARLILLYNESIQGHKLSIFHETKTVVF